jgi:PAS domain S-box-containing protein
MRCNYTSFASLHFDKILLIIDRHKSQPRVNNNLDISIALKFLDDEAFLPSGILADVNTGLIVADARLPDMPIVHINAGAENITGYRSEELIGKNCRFLQGNERSQPQIQIMRRSLELGRACNVTLRNFRKDGSPFWNEVRLMPLFDRNQALIYYAGMLSDVTASRNALLNAEHTARFDAQTGLLNRQGVIEELTTILSSDQSGELAVATCQLEELADIANTTGEEVGDELMRIAGKRMQGLASIAWTARLAFGRFLLVIQADDRKSIGEIIQSALQAMEMPYTIFGTSFALTATCGYTFLERRPENAANLMRQSALAATWARAEGSGSIMQFSAAADKAMKSRLRLISDLQIALREDELILNYQPKVDPTSGRIVGAEALLRWRHALFGMQPPSRFLPLVEKSNMIVDIGRLSLVKAAVFSARINQGRGEDPLPIAVNISPAHFRRDDFVTELCVALNAANARPEWIALELTETVLAEATPAMIRNFAELREMGIGIAVDDFGVGYSNLTYLRDFPLTELKIDQSFIRGIVSPRWRGNSG